MEIINKVDRWTKQKITQINDTNQLFIVFWILISTVISVMFYSVASYNFDFGSYDYILPVIVAIPAGVICLPLIRITFGVGSSKWEGTLTSRLKKNGKKILISYVILLYLLFFIRIELFSSKVITNNDYPIHYLRIKYTADHLLPEFRNVIGWSPTYYAGYPIHYSYIPGLTLVSSILYILLGRLIAISVIQRFFIVAAFLLAPISTYTLLKKFGYPTQYSVVAGILSAIPSSIYIHYIGWGVVPLIFATSLSPMFFAFLHEYYRKNKKSSLLFATIILSAIILIHFIVSFALILGLFLYLLIFHKKLSKKQYVNTLLFILATIFLTGFWIAPAAYNYFMGHTQSHTHIYPFFIVQTFQGFVSYHLAIFYSIPVALWLILALVYLQKKYRGKTDKKEQFILYYPIMLYLFVFYTPILIPQLNNFALHHLQPYITLYLVITAAYYSARLMEKPGSRRKLVLIALMASILTNIVFLMSPMMSIRLHTELPEDVVSSISWLKGHANHKARILVEDTDIFLQGPWGLGLRTTLLPDYLGEDVLYIGGLAPYHNFNYSLRANAAAGVFFGKPIEDTKLQEFKKNLDVFNIRYMLVWHNKSKEFMQQNRGDFTLRHETKNFSVYEYAHPPESYVINTTGSASAEVIEFGVNRIIVEVISNETSDITISSAYFPNWHAYVDGTEVPTQKEDMFLKVTVPPRGEPYKLELAFEENQLERYSKLISIISWLLVLTTTGFFMLKERHKIKREEH